MSMVSVDKFEYRSLKPKDLLLLRMNSGEPFYTIGYYDLLRNEFVCWKAPGFMEGKFERFYDCGAYRVNLPAFFGVYYDVKYIKEVTRLNDFIVEAGWLSTHSNMPEVLFGEYMLILKSGIAMLSSILKFRKIGEAFTCTVGTMKYRGMEVPAVKDIEYDDIEYFVKL